MVVVVVVVNFIANVVANVVVNVVNVVDVVVDLSLRWVHMQEGKFSHVSCFPCVEVLRPSQPIWVM